MDGIDLREVARCQRSTLWATLILLVLQIGVPVAMFGSPIVRPGMGFLNVVFLAGMVVVIAVTVMRLFMALGEPRSACVLYGVLVLIPFVGLFVMYWADHRATILLRRMGVRVGFMGVADADVVRLLSDNHCRGCGYLLIGNESGVCPECGRVRDAGHRADSRAGGIRRARFNRLSRTRGT